MFRGQSREPTGSEHTRILMLRSMHEALKEARIFGREKVSKLYCHFLQPRSTIDKVGPNSYVYSK
jgi:hypothetical protein